LKKSFLKQPILRHICSKNQTFGEYLLYVELVIRKRYDKSMYFVKEEDALRLEKILLM
jgi:hypothetical protein